MASSLPTNSHSHLICLHPLCPPLQFAFVTYSKPEAAAVAQRSVNGMLCPELNAASLIHVEFRRGPGAAHRASSVSASAAANAFAEPGAAPPGSSDGSDHSSRSGHSSRSESVRSEGAAFPECCGSSMQVHHGSGLPGGAPLAFRNNSGNLDGVPYPYPAYAVAFAYPCYLAPM